MAGNRRHAGGISSAMVNLKEIDAKIAAGRVARELPVPGAAPVPWQAHRLIGYAKNYLGRGDVALARALLDEAVATEGRADSEGGALSRARDLALASLRASLGEDHPDYALITTTPAIGKDEALKKFGRLMDRNLEVLVTEEDQRRAARAGKPDEARSIADSRAIAQVASARELQEFALQVGGFSWPATYGSSPWERAFSLASRLGFVSGLPAIEARPARTVWDRLDAERAKVYREERRRVEGVREESRAAQGGQPQALTLYIYPTEAGEVAGQILEYGRPVWGVSGCDERNAVIDAATEAGYQDLRITDVPHLNDVLAVERLREEDGGVTDRDDEQDLGR